MLYLYLNVYAVTRHYGGAEEGGWWYNTGEPLASVPILAESKIGCGDYCRQCRQAARGERDAQGQPIPYCRDLPEDYDLRVEDLARELNRENATPENPQRSWTALSEAEQDALLDRAADIFQLDRPFVHHLVPADPVELERTRSHLETLFAPEKRGDIYSVLGGVDVQIRTEEFFAISWSDYRPYE